MNRLTARLALIALFLLTPLSLSQAAEPSLPERALGKADAPLTIIEYSSLTCSHCADFSNKVLPEIEKRYIDTGKVRLVYHDFPMDAISLKAAALSHCMPQAEFFPFIKIVFNNQMTWIRADNPTATLVQYAQMAGLQGDKAKACMEDTKLLDALVAVRADATDKYSIQATPTFIFSDGDTKIIGARSLEEFSAAIDKALAKKK
jgi:protein-disulfide isomerase